MRTLESFKLAEQPASQGLRQRNCCCAAAPPRWHTSNNPARHRQGAAAASQHSNLSRVRSILAEARPNSAPRATYFNSLTPSPQKNHAQRPLPRDYARPTPGGLTLRDLRRAGGHIKGSRFWVRFYGVLLGFLQEMIFFQKRFAGRRKNCPIKTQ